MPEKLKIVIAADTFAPDINGAARFAERLAGGLSRHGHEIHIIAPAYDNTSGLRMELHDGAELFVHRMRSHKIPQHKTLRWPVPWGLKKNISKILKEVKPDALHIQSHLVIGRFAVKAAKGSGIRMLATNHIMPENLIRYSLLPKFIHKSAMKLVWNDAGRILSKMDYVTTPTRRAADLLERASGISGVLAISCGIEAARFANSTPTTNIKPIFLFLGRLDDEKRINILLEAVASLKNHPEVQVELVGDGGERDNLKRLAQRLGIADRVHFLGHITDDELPAAYERCTAFVMPSIAELQSIATMEAMASGRPVIGADAMALPHLVHDGDNGYLFPPDDVAALADRLERVLNADQTELDRLSENSLTLIQAHDIQRTLRIFEDLYVGQSSSESTTDDNAPAYTVPIGQISETLRSRLLEWREEASALRLKAEDFGNESRERLSAQFRELQSEVKEQISELKEGVTSRAKRFRRKSKD